MFNDFLLKMKNLLVVKTKESSNIIINGPIKENKGNVTVSERVNSSHCRITEQSCQTCLQFVM